MIFSNVTNKMVLGTAQFGLDYGITNLSGIPSEKEISKILDFAEIVVSACNQVEPEPEPPTVTFSPAADSNAEAAPLPAEPLVVAASWPES